MTRSAHFSLKTKQVLGAALFVMMAVGFAQTAEAKKVVKICAVLPTSGPNAAVGAGMMNSMVLAANQINASGKLGDIELEIVKLDDGSQASIGVSAVLRAAADPDVLACSAHWNSPVALATRDIFYREGLANLTPASINWRLTAEQKGDQIFRIAPPDTWQLQMAARYPISLGKKKFYLIDDNTQYGKSLVTEMEKYATPLGGEKVGSDSIAVGEKDFTAVLTKAKALSPDFIFFGGVTTESALLRQQMVKLGMDSLFYTGSGTMSPTFVSIAGAAAEGARAYFYGLPYQSYPGGKAFTTAYAAAGFDKPPETYGIWAYACIEVLADAVKRAAAEGKLNRSGIIDVLKDGKFSTVLGDISFPPPGDVKQRVMGYYVVEKGNWVMTDFSKEEADSKIVKLDAPVPLDAQ
ncbi:branched-chain amino acid ABC transporter substrate-binding protein [Bradyrhizobium canariense]|uniref:Amino acid/amide ABC transporter substrate-binding protein, HAAT family n=1 Tax=Bradyrhizobium canariense TaxID=255045 RepID=A0A1H1SIN5_9BRAD|nr:branched-chain amino acid ABC transporter substrate-binding protein [Bradyrhizobium canariense]SDS47835.1 amino acid/amide ABC transporter substrate-binding protein, HAAT family [Bradyrhizobium canariense]